MRRNAFTSCAPALAVVGLIGLLDPSTPAFAASNDWSRVAALEKYTEVRVDLRDGQSRSGRVVAAGPDSLTVRSMGEDERIPRDAVQRVTRFYTGSSGPAVMAAVAAGVAATASVFYMCSRPGSSCEGAGEGFVVMLAIPVMLGYAAHKHTATDRMEIVYEAVPDKKPTDMPTDWETIRRALPPSLQGLR
jgi:hypothetical protein